MCSRHRAARTFVVVLLMGSFGVARPARGEPVESLVEHRGEAFVAAMNAPGAEALAAFAREHLESRLAAADAIPKIVAALERHRAVMGAIDRHSVQVVSGGRALFVFARGATAGTWSNFQFRILADDGHRLQLVFVAQAIEPMARPSTPIDDPATHRWLHEFVDRLEAQQPFSGVVRIEKEGRELLTLTRGVAVAERNESVAPSTRFGMASGSKLFTAVAVLQLVDAGKLSLDSRLGDLLPNFPNRDWAAGVTVRRLLTHTAGAGNYWDDEYERHWNEITELGQMLPHVLRHVGETPAGEFSYSNSGYLLLGLVVEAVSGRSFYDYVAERIFAPAGMRATGYPSRADAPPGLAVPYLPEYEAGAVKRGSFRPVMLGARGTSAGGAATTAADLAAFARALADGTLLRPETFREMVRPQVAEGDAEGAFWGLGPSVRTEGGIVSWGHGGTARGTQFDFKVYPEKGIVAIVMSNYDTIAAVEIAKAIDDIVRGRRQALVVPATPSAAARGRRGGR